MSEQSGNESRYYKIVMSEEGYQAFHELADDAKRPLADIFRDAMQEYLEKHGKDANVRVRRGGHRAGAGRKGKTEEESS